MTFSHNDAMNLKNEMKPLFLFVGVFSSKQKLFWNPGLTSNCYLDFIGRVTLMVVISESSYQTCRNLRRLEQE